MFFVLNSRMTHTVFIFRVPQYLSEHAGSVRSTLRPSVKKLHLQNTPKVGVSPEPEVVETRGHHQWTSYPFVQEGRTWFQVSTTFCFQDMTSGQPPLKPYIPNPKT